MERRHPDCLNCGEPTPGEFCGNCGQRNTDLHASFWELAKDLLGEAFEADSRIARTVGPFLLRPGFLTNEHNAGRRVRYSSPLRLYLFCSFAYFFALSFGERAGIKVGESPAAAHVEIPTDAPEGMRSARKDEDLHIDGWGVLGHRLEQRVNEVKHLQPDRRDEFKRRLQATFIESLPKAIFVLLPISALLLKLLFWRTRKFYVEHLTLAFHVHAFAFLVLLVVLGLEAITATARWPGLLLLLVPAYVLIALRTVYGQRWAWTITKLGAFAFVYLLLVAVALASAAMIGFLTA